MFDQWIRGRAGAARHLDHRDVCLGGKDKVVIALALTSALTLVSGLLITFVYSIMCSPRAKKCRVSNNILKAL